MNETEKTFSITIKGISAEVKENFSLFCSSQGKSMQEVLVNFINSVYSPNENEKLMIKYQALMNMANSHQNLIDEWISDLEPLYNTLNDFQKSAARYSYINLNPTQIYKKYETWLNKE